MQIKRFQVVNYKGFNDGNEIYLETGTVVLTGRNSSGKTAALEALSLGFGHNAHRSLRKPLADNSASVIRLVVELRRDELLEFGRGSLGPLLIPVPRTTDQLVRVVPGLENAVLGGSLSPREHKAFLDWVFSGETLSVRVVRTVFRSGQIQEHVSLIALEELPQNKRGDGTSEYAQCLLRNGDIQSAGSAWIESPPNSFPGLAAWVASRIYRFSPERFCAGASPYGDNSILKADGSNLPEAINSLQPHPLRFQAFNDLVSRVLPQVKWIDTRPRTPNNEIWIWHFEKKDGRDDLAIPLSDCGTGVGHVLAILYVLFTAEGSRTILIDEPQSFLHPGAARRLMDVLSEFPHHQLVIATHSSTIISAGAVRQVLCINVEGEALISSLAWEDATHRAALLNELGARLADVYGADDIIWVEGPTEEECFPKILHSLSPGLLSGTAILAVRKTGDLEGKDAERVFEIYSSLSNSSSLLPPTVAFVFDRECWTLDKVKELKAKSKGLLRMTDRRTYENYLLHPKAIATLINQSDPDRDTPVNAEDIEEAIGRERRDPKLLCDVRLPDASQQDLFDAPRALKKLFNEVTQSRVAYVKTSHSVALTEWILENDPQFLQPVADLLKEVLCSRSVTQDN